MHFDMINLIYCSLLVHNESSHLLINCWVFLRCGKYLTIDHIHCLLILYLKIFALYFEASWTMKFKDCILCYMNWSENGFFCSKCCHRRKQVNTVIDVLLFEIDSTPMIKVWRDMLWQRWCWKMGKCNENVKQKHASKYLLADGWIPSGWLFIK